MDDRAEVARLANIALAEVGIPLKASASGQWTGDRRDYPMAHRAAMLALMHIHGPDYMTFCAPCALQNADAACPRFPVRDALNGRACGAS